MKKLLLLAVAAIMGIGMVSAKSVDVNTAKALGHKFVQANFEQGSAADLQLVYTFSNQRGESSLTMDLSLFLQTINSVLLLVIQKRTASIRKTCRQSAASI